MKIRLHVTTLLVLAFGGLVLVSSGSMFFLVLTNAVSGTQDALAARIEALIQEAREASRSNYEPLENIGRWLVGEISAGRLDPRDRERFTALVEGALATMPQADAVTYQMLNGNGYYFKNDDDTLETVFWPPQWRVSRRGVSAEGRWVLRPSALDGQRRGTFITTARD